MAYKFNPTTGELDLVTPIYDPATDVIHVLKAGDTMTGELDITYEFPTFKVKNTDFSQYAGASFYLINTPSSMGNQAGVTHYMGILDTSATQGFYAIDKTNVSGGGTGHLMLFDHNANTNYFYAPLSMSTNKITDVINPTNAQDVATKNYVDVTPKAKMFITTGSNASAGTGTLIAGTVTISTTSVTANSLIFLTDTASTLTNIGTLSVSSKTATTSFTVTSANALDTSTFNWLIIN